MTVVDFFYFFDELEVFVFFRKKRKVIGPDASENVLGRFRRSGRASWGIRGGIQEASSEILGLSGGVRGASWGGLGRSWGDLSSSGVEKEPQQPQPETATEDLGPI